MDSCLGLNLGWWTGACLPIQLFLVLRLMMHCLPSSSWLTAWVIRFGWCSEMCLLWRQIILAICLMRSVCRLVVGCMLGYFYWLVVWNPLLLDPSVGVFGRFDLLALLRLPHLTFLFVC